MTNEVVVSGRQRRVVRKCGDPGACTVGIFEVTLLLGAFLLFQVELIISKYILPWFGGSAAVWTTSLLVFQLLLMAGYIYVHLLTTRFRRRMQAVVHLCVVGVSMVF